MGIIESKFGFSRQKKIVMLENAPFYSFVPRDSIVDLAKCFTCNVYKPGKVVACENQDFFIVARGSVDISTIVPGTHKDHHITDVICQKKQGEILTWCGRQNIVAKLTTSTAKKNAKHKNISAYLDTTRITADKVTGCALLKLDKAKFMCERKKTLSKVVSSRTADKTAGDQWSFISKMANEGPLEVLFSIPWLENVKRSRVVMLADLCSYQCVKKGDMLFKEGSFGNRMYICVHGDIEISIERRDKKITLNKIPEKGYFGEIALLANISRTASATALNNCMLVYIDRSTFRNFVKVVPEAASILGKRAAFYLLDKLSGRNMSFFGAMSKLDLLTMADLCSIHEYPKGSIIFKAGDNSELFYIMIAGEAEEITEGSSVVTTYKESHYFGEVGLILRMAHTSTVTAKNECVMILMAKDDFIHFFQKMPEIFSEFCMKVHQLDSDIKTVMHHYSARELYRKFLNEKRDVHDIDFFESAEDLLQNKVDDNALLKEEAKAIYEEFLKLPENEEKNIKLSDECMNSIQACLKDDEVQSYIYESAMEEIIEQLGGNIFEEFKNSASFAALLKKIGNTSEGDRRISAKTNRRLSFSSFRKMAGQSPEKKKTKYQIHVQELQDKELRKSSSGEHFPELNTWL